MLPCGMKNSVILAVVIMTGAGLTGCGTDWSMNMSDNINTGGIVGGVVGAVAGYTIAQLLSPSIPVSIMGAAAGALGAGYLGQKWAAANPINVNTVANNVGSAINNSVNSGVNSFNSNNTTNAAK